MDVNVRIVDVGRVGVCMFRMTVSRYTGRCTQYSSNRRTKKNTSQLCQKNIRHVTRSAPPWQTDRNLLSNQIPENIPTWIVRIQSYITVAGNGMLLCMLHSVGLVVTHVTGDCRISTPQSLHLHRNFLNLTFCTHWEKIF